MLLVDDDIELSTQLQAAFAVENLELAISHSAEAALLLMVQVKFDLLILDWDLPGMDGVTLCRRNRENGGGSYVIFLTGHGDISSKEAALEAGGDDFLTKPFYVRELLARIRSVTRRSPDFIADVITIKGLSLATDQRAIIVGDKQAELTKKECALLEYLMRHPNRPITAQKLLTAVWPSETDSSVETVRTWMMHLREKLSELGKPDFIKTVVRAGYVIETE